MRKIINVLFGSLLVLVMPLCFLFISPVYAEESNPEPLKIYPVDDAQLSEEYPNDNYDYGSKNKENGEQGVLITYMHNPNWTANSSIAYMKFDISAIEDINSKFEVCINAYNSRDLTDTLCIYGVDVENAEWTENTITWNSAPEIEFSGEIDSVGIEGQATKPYSLDITDYVKEQYNEGKTQITLAFQPRSPFYSIRIYSKDLVGEHNASPNPPYILVLPQDPFDEELEELNRAESVSEVRTALIAPQLNLMLHMYYALPYSQKDAVCQTILNKMPDGGYTYIKDVQKIIDEEINKIVELPTQETEPYVLQEFHPDDWDGVNANDGIFMISGPWVGSGGNTFLPENVTLTEDYPGQPSGSGFAHLKSIANDKKGSEIASEYQKFKYGYYETRMKVTDVGDPINNRGVCTGIFLWDNESRFELDVEILTNDPWIDDPNSGQITFNYHGYASAGHYHDLDFNLSQDFHTYGMLWLPGRVSWTVDGEIAYTVYEPGFTNDDTVYILITTWTGKPEWGGYSPVIDAITVYDWIKFYTIDEVDKTALEEAIKSALQLDQSGYTQQERQSINDALNAARSTDNNLYTTQAEIDDAVARLENVMNPVQGENLPPEFEDVEDKSVNVGSTLQFTVSATDPDGDGLTYSATNLPTGASFDEENQTFNWTPQAGQEDNYTVSFSVTDGVNQTVQMTVEITVNPAAEDEYAFTIGNVSIDKQAGIAAEATITANPDKGGDAVVIFKLIKTDGTVIGLYSSEQYIEDSATLRVKFHGYSGDEYKVKVYVWDELDSSFFSIGTNMADPVEIQ